MRNFRELAIWNQGIDLAVKGYELMRQMPKEELYGLTSQIKRALVSIPSNIAEGSSRNTERDFSKFLRISLGSSFEIETDLIIAERLEFLESTGVQTFLADLRVEQRQINRFLNEVVKRANSQY